MLDLIYAADNRPYSEIALDCGLFVGLQLPNKVHMPPYFTDQDWNHPVRDRYLDLLRTYRPALATVLDWTRPEQLGEVFEWAETAAEYVDTVIIVPKVHGGVSRIPERIGGKPVRLGYSVPTSYGGTELMLWEFGTRPVHLLGGSHKQHLKLARYLNVKSIDSNYIHRKIKVGQFWDGERWLQLRDRGINVSGRDIPETVLRLSWANMLDNWRKYAA